MYHNIITCIFKLEIWIIDGQGVSEEHAGQQFHWELRQSEVSKSVSANIKYKYDMVSLVDENAPFRSLTK